MLGSVLIGASVPITDGHPTRVADGVPAGLSTAVAWCRLVGRDPIEHWAKYDADYWQDHHDDFLWFFFGMCFPEPHSTKPIEDAVGVGPRDHARRARRRAARAVAEPGDVRGVVRAASRSPVLTIHGDGDLISPLARGAADSPS